MAKVNDRSSEKLGYMALSLFTLFLLIPLDTFQVFGQISILRFAALLPIVIGLFQIRKMHIKRNPASMYLMLYIILIALTLPYSYSVSSSANEFMMYAMYALLIFFATGFTYNDREKKMIMAGLVGSSVMALLLLCGFSYEYEGRLSIMVNSLRPEDPNQFSGYLIPGALYMLHSLLSKDKFRFLYLVGAGIFGYAVLLTGSRGGLLALVLGAIALTWLHIRRRSKTFMGAFAAVGCAIIIILTITTQLIGYLNPEIVNRFTIEDIANTGGTGREDIWKENFDLFVHSPFARQLFGYGIGTMSDMGDKVAHNNWVQVLVEMGVLGLIVYSLMMVSVAIMLARSRNALALAIFISYLGLTVSLSLFSYKPIWAIFIIAIIFHNVKDTRLRAGLRYNEERRFIKMRERLSI